MARSRNWEKKNPLINISSELKAKLNQKKQKGQTYSQLLDGLVKYL